MLCTDSMEPFLFNCVVGTKMLRRTFFLFDIVRKKKWFSVQSVILVA